MKHHRILYRALSALLCLVLCTQLTACGQKDTFSPASGKRYDDSLITEAISKEGSFTDEHSQEWDYSYHIPQLADDTADAESINKAIMNILSSDAQATLSSSSVTKMPETHYADISWQSHWYGSLLSLSLHLTGWASDIVSYEVYHYDFASGRRLTNAQVLDRFVRFLEEHPGETLLVHMKYENTSTNANKRGWNKSVVSYIKSRCNGRIADFTPRMTLADARGKILFVIREDYKSDNGGEYLGAYLNWTNDKVVFETTLHGNTGEAAPIKVNDLYNIKNGASDGVSKYAAIDECIAYTYNATDVARWCMNYVSCYDRDHCSVTGLGILGALGDYDYCANRYNRYTADKLNRPDFRGNAGIVLMDFAGASNATMTYGQTYSNMAVYGDDLVEAVIGANNKWDLRRNE